MFFNEALHHNNTGSPVLSNHKLFDFSKGLDMSLIFVVMLPFFIYIKVILRKFSMQLHKLNEKKNKRMYVDGDWNLIIGFNENLGCYWECLQGIY